MSCDRVDRGDVDCLSQAWTDKAEVTFCPIPKMPALVVISNGVYVGLCNTPCVVLCDGLNCKSI